MTLCKYSLTKGYTSSASQVFISTKCLGLLPTSCWYFIVFAVIKRSKTLFPQQPPPRPSVQSSRPSGEALDAGTCSCDVRAGNQHPGYPYKVNPSKMDGSFELLRSWILANSLVSSLRDLWVSQAQLSTSFWKFWNVSVCIGLCLSVCMCTRACGCLQRPQGRDRSSRTWSCYKYLCADPRGCWDWNSGPLHEEHCL